VRNLLHGIALNDVNRNGSPDLVVGDGNNNAWAIDGRTRSAAWYEPVVLASPCLSLAWLSDFNHDGIRDFVAGTAAGGLFCVSGRGDRGLWSYWNPGEGHGFELCTGTRDLDGNGQMDVLAAMADGTVLCFAGTYIGDTIESVEEPVVMPPDLMLLVDPAYPNPFNAAVVIPLRLGQPGVVQVAVYDLLGREVHRFNTGRLRAGAHQLVWDGTVSGRGAAPSGVYMVQVETGAERVGRAVQLVR
jgi:hypothetical protein